ncbi:MAG: hypothetical protein ACYDFR_04105, partial [Candidatus Omnitrophota bacterium]
MKFAEKDMGNGILKGREKDDIAKELNEALNALALLFKEYPELEKKFEEKIEKRETKKKQAIFKGELDELKEALLREVETVKGGLEEVKEGVMRGNESLKILIDTAIRELILNKIKELIKDFRGEKTLDEVAIEAIKWFMDETERVDSGRLKKILKFANDMLKEDGKEAEEEKVNDYVIGLINELKNSQQAKQELKRAQKQAREIQEIKEQLNATKEQQRIMIETSRRDENGIMKEADCFKSILLTVAGAFSDKVLTEMVREKLQELADKGIVDLESIMTGVNDIIKIRKQQLLDRGDKIAAGRIYEFGLYGLEEDTLLTPEASNIFKDSIFFTQEGDVFHAFRISQVTADKKHVIVAAEDSMKGRF